MKYQVLWRFWRVSPAILGATLVASSGAVAFESPGTVAPPTATASFTAEPTPSLATKTPPATVTTQPQTVDTSVAIAQPEIGTTSESKLENSVTVDTGTPEMVAEVPVKASDGNVREQINHYSNESDLHSADQVTNVSQLQDFSPNTVNSSDASVLEQNNQYSNESSADALDQVTNVSQLRDVSPGDWAFEALRSLVERYGCIAGYPDRTFRGNRSMTRYEFAAGLNACLQQIDRLIKARGEGSATREDFATLERLISEFGTELATLRGDVDALEARTRELELTQFSTTTKLDGEVVLGLTGIVAGENIFGEKVDDVEIFGGRTRLNFETSFTGQDLLRTRLQAFGLSTFTSRTLTYEGNLAFADEDANNDVKIDALLYSFPIGQSTQVVIAANAGAADDFASTVNFLDGDGAFGALSRFGTRNPIYYLVEGSGIGIRQQLGNTLELSLGYLAGDAGNTRSGGGLFGGPYGALAQLVYKPSDRFQIGFTYINSYNRETLTGSPLSNPRTLLRNLADQPANINFQPPGIPGTPRFFPANQPIAAGQLLPVGTQLPVGTTLNAPTTLPFPITIGAITFPTGTTIPAGTTLPAPITLPTDLALPAPITLPIDLTIPAAITLPPPIAFNGTVGELLSQPNFAGIPLGFDLNIPIISNSYGIQLSWQASDNFVLGGWVGYTTTTTLSTGNGLFSRGNINTINGAITLAFPDIGKKGNLGGIIVGVEPFVLDTDIQVNPTLANPSSLNPALIPAGLALLSSSPAIRGLVNNFNRPDPDVSLHIEGFYQMRLTDNISVTPGVIWITAPGSLGSNSDIVIGTLRTTFTF
jgi:hypothetical protein